MSDHHVLIVDDHDDNRYYLSTLLGAHGYTIDLAADGAVALDMARRKRPVLIISDILMPVMDGFALCRTCKQDPDLKATPFLFYTATYTDERDREFALSLGAQGYLTKPQEVETFMATVNALAGTPDGPPRTADGGDAMPPAPSDRVLPLDSETSYLKQYNATLVRKLEVKMAQLQEANTELRHQLEARRRIEAELLQARKLEAIGRLAGGVAHDFNNLLMGIMSYAELGRDEAPDDRLRSRLDGILDTAQRASNLTRQLLGFARRQAIAPVVLDLNIEIRNMLDLLGRLVGETVELAWEPGDALWPTRLDPAQLDQLLTNLCINARDAMDGKGRLIISTANLTLEAPACHEQAARQPGDYVCLTVRDTGQGMDERTRASLFEPFYTTKGPGGGTGLGLSTVYGIVMQNGGFIDVESAPHQGATFRIYLRRHAQAGATVASRPSNARASILLVEDEVSIRTTMQAVLESLGYHVACAADGEAALRLVKTSGDAFDLLITDVVMPGMNGYALATELSVRQPGIKCLFMSGYTTDAMPPKGFDASRVQLLVKPFGGDTIKAKIKAILGDQP